MFRPCTFLLYTCTVSVKPVLTICVQLYSHSKESDLVSVCLVNISDKTKIKMIENVVSLRNVKTNFR